MESTVPSEILPLSPNQQVELGLLSIALERVEAILREQTEPLTDLSLCLRYLTRLQDMSTRAVVKERAHSPCT